ncbi:lipase, putative [Talaromyces stipitatus ATCC 10500]|uniref:Lipase, putative n=1 Tax=Talaromyces stipitatus (strain ATCC 10500 / CBS 375.48 / QM 6759 / NRRL 1006) TaxID=441959 RepID=B8ML55_TALSN|nr:lipase, putative [Talaromyces stipitatus ATCC 10500]EED15471.1 lipase, putative [Talaromyces stipitatus ATCC 10500]
MAGLVLLSGVLPRILACYLNQKIYKMIDHVLGRPSTQFRKIQVLTVVSFWSLYLFRGNNHGPPGLRNLSTRLRDRLTPWQTMVITLLWLYVARNFSKIMGFESPEPLANLYSRSYFRATWITTALDAGFWTAMKIRPKWLRDIASMVFSLYYLVAAEQADEKVRRVRATLTVEHLRVSWNKATTPYLSVLNAAVRPRYTKYAPRQIRIARLRESAYREPVNAWLYFDGSLAELREQTQLVLDIPGGGYVAMNPRTADDKLLAWAGKTRVPILSLDYKKAPEFPYPKGRCVGLAGHSRPHIVVSGDSAGGNLATGMTIMILQSGRTEARKWLGEVPLPAPDGLVLIYPSLDMNIGSWMTEEQMSLIQDRGMRRTNENVLRRKSEDYSRLTPKSSHSLSSGHHDSSPVKDYFSSRPQPVDKTDPTSQNQPTQIKTRIAVSSMISYFGDRILTPEMMRAMIILYIGPHNRPDFKTDFLLSPILAPDAILAAFPKTYFLTGERDPLVDDTVIFAGRIRQAKLHRFRERQELALEKSRVEFNEKDYVEVNLIPGISHGFINFPGIFPDSWRHIHKCARWIVDLLQLAAERELKASVSSVSSTAPEKSLKTSDPNGQEKRHDTESRRSSLAESSADEDHPLEMNFTPIKNTNIISKDSDKKAISTNTQTKPSDSSNLKDIKQRRPRRPSLSTPNKPLSFPLQLPLLKTINKSANRTGPKEYYDAQDNDDDDANSAVSAENGKTFTRLPSEEDLIGRRMDGLAGGLMGLGEGVRTP